MTTGRNEERVVVAGASTLLGSEVKAVLEESRFAGWDLRLVDEDEAAGIVTEAAGEAAIIQKLDEDTFRGARYAFLTGSEGFGKQCLKAARAAGATAIDLTHASLRDPDAALWFPKIESLSGKQVNKNAAGVLRVFGGSDGRGEPVFCAARAVRSAADVRDVPGAGVGSGTRRD